MNKISVIIPTFNRKDHLEKLLDQFMQQRPAGVDLSIIAVVDGSTDGTMEMLQTRVPRVQIVEGNGHWWWTKSVNEGCKVALKNGTDAILLMNDDTEIDDTYLHTLVQNARSQPGAVIGSLNITTQTPHQMYFSGVPKITWWNARSVRYHPMFAPYDENMSGLHKSVILLGRGLFIPAEVFDTVGFFDEAAFPQYKADLDFALCAFEKGLDVLISWDAIVYSYLDLTGKGSTYMQQSFWEFLGAFFGHNTYTNLRHSFRYYKKHCPLYLLPLSYTLDKCRLVFSYWQKRFRRNSTQS
ncbi:MAG: glycosyltransferase family 2 protein [bacterium]|nr:glycosyltransferase family 2 protein [bacterium]